MNSSIPISKGSQRYHTFDSQEENKKRKKYFLYLSVLVILAQTIIILCIYFIPIRENQDDRKFYTESTCKSTSLQRNDSRCCKVDKCICSQCDILSSSCDTISQKGSNGTCCGNSCCAVKCCKMTCCVKGVCFCCRTDCCSTVQETCLYDCGTCSNYVLTFELGYNSQLYNLNLFCGQDDNLCKENFETVYKVNNTWDCWYDQRDPENINFTGIPAFNRAAYVFFWIFLSTLSITVVGTGLIIKKLRE